jgi:hypothetical protein
MVNAMAAARTKWTTTRALATCTPTAQAFHIPVHELFARAQRQQREYAASEKSQTADAADAHVTISEQPILPRTKRATTDLTNDLLVT